MVISMIIITLENSMSMKRTMRKKHSQQSNRKIIRRSIRPMKSTMPKNTTNTINMEMGNMDMIIMQLIIPR